MLRWGLGQAVGGGGMGVGWGRVGVGEGRVAIIITRCRSATPVSMLTEGHFTPAPSMWEGSCSVRLTDIGL